MQVPRRTASHQAFLALQLGGARPQHAAWRPRSCRSSISSRRSITEPSKVAARSSALTRCFRHERSARSARSGSIPGTSRGGPVLRGAASPLHPRGVSGPALLPGLGLEAALAQPPLAVVDAVLRAEVHAVLRAELHARKGRLGGVTQRSIPVGPAGRPDRGGAPPRGEGPPRSEGLPVTLGEHGYVHPGGAPPGEVPPRGERQKPRGTCETPPRSCRHASPALGAAGPSPGNGRRAVAAAAGRAACVGGTWRPAAARAGAFGAGGAAAEPVLARLGLAAGHGGRPPRPGSMHESDFRLSLLAAVAAPASPRSIISAAPRGRLRLLRAAPPRLPRKGQTGPWEA